MTPIYRSDQVRAIDRRAIESHGVPSLVLMENAARGACDALLESGIELPDAHVVIVCGRGNNGGDGLALARHCAIHGADVECILLDSPGKLSDDAAVQLAALESLVPGSVSRWHDHPREPIVADVLVDALLGTGAIGEPRGDYADAIDWLNESHGVRVALDMPTGVDADTGIASAHAVRADVTVTMAALKPGLVLGDGARCSGTVYIVHIGIPESSYPDAACWLLDRDTAAALLPGVDRARNKYDRGKVLVVAGARGMTGAAVMTAEAAARAGAGLTVLALPESAMPLPQSLAAEIMTRLLPAGPDGTLSPEAFEMLRGQLPEYRAIAIGPGLSKSPGAGAFVDELVRSSAVPIILDADGLAGYAGAIERLADRRCDLVITPHHGEMARLLGITSAAVGNDPLETARDAARRSRAIVVLKGAPSIVAFPDVHAWINGAGNPGMASGGSGDVLTGVIASLVAQSERIGEATLAAVYLHSHAADLASEETTVRALMATDITRHLSAAYSDLEEAAS